MCLKKKTGFARIEKVVRNMENDWKKTLWEAVKEPLREIVIAIIPFALERLSVLPDLWAVVLYLALRGIDKYLHNQAEEGVSGGLSRF